MEPLRDDFPDEKLFSFRSIVLMRLSESKLIKLKKHELLMLSTESIAQILDMELKYSELVAARFSSELDLHRKKHEMYSHCSIM